MKSFFLISLVYASVCMATEIPGCIGKLPVWDGGDIELFVSDVDEADQLWKEGQLEKACTIYKKIIEASSENCIVQGVKIRLCVLEFELGLDALGIQNFYSVINSITGTDDLSIFLSDDIPMEKHKKAAYAVLPKLKSYIFEHPLRLDTFTD